MTEKLVNASQQKDIIPNDISGLKEDIKRIYKSSVEPIVDAKLKKFSSLAKNNSRTKQQEKELNVLSREMVYPFLLDNGTLLSSIPNMAEKQWGLLAIRERLIVEHGCKTAAELILVDQIASAYWRLMKYEMYANRLPEKNEGWSFDQLMVNVLKEARQQIEQAHRQINMALTQLKDIKQPALKVSVKAYSAYFAQNQQVINEKPQNEPAVETIKPK